MLDHAILDGKKVVPASFMDWAMWLETNRSARMVARDNVGDVYVSTVFLGLNHSYTKEAPLWFETMIFNGKHDQWQDRYATWEEAEEGHKKAVELVKSDL